MTDEPLEAAVAASALAGEEAHEELLQSIVEVARAVFEAKATSITTYDEETDELVFRAATGNASPALIGQRFPSGTGLTGFVLRTREPLVLDDVGGDPRFARDIAESTGYMPRALMAAPLLHGERALGVLTVLDRPSDRPFRMAEMELLVLVAQQGAIALDVVGRARGARATLAGEGEAATLANLARALNRLEPDRRDPAVRLLEALERILTGSPY